MEVRRLGLDALPASMQPKRLSVTARANQKSRARHVKCDENKPDCNRCTRAGRPCGGYIPPSRSTSPHGQMRMIHYVSTPPRHLSPASAGDWREQRAFAFFRERTAPELTGPFSGDLYTQSILILAEFHPSVRNAVIALGSAHEDFAKRDTTQTEIPEFSLQHYGKAIKQVLELTRPKGGMIEVVMATCIVFSCLEILRGFVASSVSHIIAGMKLLEEGERDQTLQHLHCISADILNMLFVRFDCQLMAIGGQHFSARVFPPKLRPTAMPSSFSSLEEASTSLVALFDAVQHLMYGCEQIIQDPNHTEEDIERIRQEFYGFEAARQVWEQAFGTISATLKAPDEASSRQRAAATLALQMTNRCIRIVLNVDFIDPDMDFDDWHETFRLILDEAERYVSLTTFSRPFDPSQPPLTHPSPPPTQPSPPHQYASNASTPNAQSTYSHPSPSLQTLRALSPKPPPIRIPTFTMSQGCVLPLYFIASRCREPGIRHRALSLLYTCNRREGLWDSLLAAQIADKIITVEEQNAVHDMSTEDLARVSPSGSGAALIRSEHRIRAVDMDFGSEADGVAKYSFTYPRRDNTGKLMTGNGKWNEEVEFEELMRW